MHHHTCILLQSVYPQTPSKHETNTKVGVFGLHEHFAQQSIMRHCILTKMLCHVSASDPAFGQQKHSPLLSWQQNKLCPPVLHTLVSTALPRSAFLCTPVLGVLCCTHCRGTQTWKLGFAAAFSAFQLQIRGLLENQGSEWAHMSLVFLRLVGNERGTAWTPFLY